MRSLPLPGDGSILHGEERIIRTGPIEDRLQSRRVAVGDENLSESLLRHQPDQLFDTPRVEFVEEIVQQQQRPFVLLFGHKSVLGEFERDEERFLLSLRAV